MLAIRMQRTGRKGRANFRIVVQDSHWSPSSGKVVARLGSYNPHTKEVIVSKEKAEFYLKNGAQPSDRAALLLKSEGVKLPKWVNVDNKKTSEIRNPEKLRKNRPAEAPAEAKTEETTEAPKEVDEASAPEAEESKAPEAQAPVAEAAEPAKEAEPEVVGTVETKSDSPAESVEPAAEAEK